MNTSSFFLPVLILATTLVACGPNSDADDRDYDNMPVRTRGTEQNPGADGAITQRDNTATQHGQSTLTMACLELMDLRRWRELGLSDDQLARVQQLQQDLRTRTGRTTSDQRSADTTADNDLTGIAYPDLDESAQHNLTTILDSEQMAELGRRCNDGTLNTD